MNSLQSFAHRAIVVKGYCVKEMTDRRFPCCSSLYEVQYIEITVFPLVSGPIHTLQRQHTFIHEEKEMGLYCHILLLRGGRSTCYPFEFVLDI